MSTPSQQEAQFGAAKKAVCTAGKASEDKEIPKAEDVSRSELAAGYEDDDDVPYLTGEHFFDVVLSASHITHDLPLPVCAIRMLPRANVPVDLRHGGKSWEVSYTGVHKRPRFDKWNTFVTDNHLKIGDACVFELMDQVSSKVTFKVHILKGDLPPELQAKVDSMGTTPDQPINLD